MQSAKPSEDAESGQLSSFGVHGRDSGRSVSIICTVCQLETCSTFFGSWRKDRGFDLNCRNFVQFINTPELTLGPRKGAIDHDSAWPQPAFPTRQSPEWDRRDHSGCGNDQEARVP